MPLEQDCWGLGQHKLKRASHGWRGAAAQEGEPRPAKGQQQALCVERRRLLGQRAPHKRASCTVDECTALSRLTVMAASQQSRAVSGSGLEEAG